MICRGRNKRDTGPHGRKVTFWECLSVNPDKIDSLVQNGVGFDGSSIAGYARVENSDRLLLPDPETLHTIQFADETAGLFIGNTYDQQGDRSPVDPRALLERVMNEAENEFGFRFTIGPEHEFFLLGLDDNGNPHHTDSAGYFHASPHDTGEVVRKRIVRTLKSAGIPFKKHHHEVTSSQHEINLAPANPLEGTDRTVIFNYIAQRVAAESGCHASFMPKPFNNDNRNAFHLHLSMYDQNDNNLFYQKGRQHNLSDIAGHFIGGILKFARETSIVRGWGYANRSSMVRIPYIDKPINTRLELRSPDPSGNVYLQVAVLIAMGIQGVREKMNCGKPDAGSTYKKQYSNKIIDRKFLPKSMFEAWKNGLNNCKTV